jgi:hypothetical protein
MMLRHRCLVASLFLASLACNALGSGALLEDDFSGGDITWGTGTDAESSVEYSNGALNFVVTKDLYFVWSTPNDQDYEKIHIEVSCQQFQRLGRSVWHHLQFADHQYILLFCCYGGEYAIGVYVAGDQSDKHGQWNNSSLIKPRLIHINEAL